MNILENVKQFLSDNKDALNSHDFETIYSNSIELGREEIGLMTGILLQAGFNPL